MNITTVQKIATQSLYDIRGYKYKDLVKEALGVYIDINSLSFDQAVEVIQHGNVLYKQNKQ